MELGILLNGVEPEFVGRVTRLLVQKRHIFMTVILGGGLAKGTLEPDWALFKLTQLGEDLVAAARERNHDLLAVIEHKASIAPDRVVL